ncbi:MAG: DNA polymerase III subunit gamma/tau [Clostridiales bacterium]|nr:DNA polymerase III subunit gamma/tau [Clostridiales bacterium]
MYQALYRAYRPETFDEILGQEHIIRILKNQIATDSVSHAYLFCGTRGTGKTTTARILAKGLNCLSDGDRPCGTCDNCRAIKDGNFMDVIELDAASNNGVDNIRELRESVKYPPVVGRKKIYIIDEVHMLSTGAFNALLKTLEEPPENVVFILATTEPQKLPATILSRCMRLDFRRVPENTLVSGMTGICADRGINVTEGALRLIAANADGSVRDGLSILDQCISSGQSEVTREDVLDFLGTSGIEVFVEMTEYTTSGKTAEALLLLSEILADGKDVRQFMKDWLAHYRGLLISKFVKSPEDILNMSTENTMRLKEQAEKLDLGEINEAILEISKTASDAKWSTQPRVLLELCIVKLSEKGSGFVAPKTRPREEVKREPRNIVTQPETKKEVPAFVSAETVPDVDNETPAGNEMSAPDLESLWHRVFEEGEAYKTSFNLIRTGTKLEELTDKFFVVSASNSLKLKYLDENRETLESLMEKYTGVRRALKAVMEGDSAVKKEFATEDLKGIAENAFGIKIDIE